MSDYDKYRRLKLISYLLIATKREDKKDGENGDKEDDKRGDNGEDETMEVERAVPYENNRFLIIILVVLFADLLKNGYLFYMPMSLSDRLLWGDIIISYQEDQRLILLGQLHFDRLLSINDRVLLLSVVWPAKALLLPPQQVLACVESTGIQPKTAGEPEVR